LWSNGATTEDLSGLTAGTFNLTITDKNGCTTTLNETITQPAATLSATKTKTDVLCFGNSTGAINVTTAGGTTPYTYLWSNGLTTEDLSGLIAGTFSLTITDNKGCSTTLSETITQPAAGLSAIKTKTDVLCFGNSTGAINVTIAGGTTPYTYLWSNGATTEDLSGLLQVHLR
jgi:carbohydrate-selective porin OprB